MINIMFSRIGHRPFVPAKLDLLFVNILPILPYAHFKVHILVHGQKQ